MANIEEAISQFRLSREALHTLNDLEQEPSLEVRSESETAYFTARQAVTDQLLAFLTGDDRQALLAGLQEYRRQVGILHARALARYAELDARTATALEGASATAEPLSDPYWQIRAEQNGVDEYYNNLIEKAIEILIAPGANTSVN